MCPFLHPPSIHSPAERSPFKHITYYMFKWRNVLSLIACISHTRNSYKQTDAAQQTVPLLSRSHTNVFESIYVCWKSRIYYCCHADIKISAKIVTEFWCVLRWGFHSPIACTRYYPKAYYRKMYYVGRKVVAPWGHHLL